MNANDVIESYVTDVAAKLPRRQRNDVAFELRSLLHDELAANAAEQGELRTRRWRWRWWATLAAPPKRHRATRRGIR